MRMISSLVMLCVIAAVAGLRTSQADDVAMRLDGLKALQTERTAASLVRVLRLNGDKTTNVEKLGHPTDSGGIKDVDEIRSAGNSYIAVVARRFPSEVKPPFDEHGLGICFLFDKQGNLKARFGGELGLDRLNGDDVQLKTLGTPDRWFVHVRRFEKFPPFTHRSDVYLVDDGFPLALRLWEYPNALGWTTKPHTEEDAAGYSHFFNPGSGDLPWGTLGEASDGKQYKLIIGWDPAEAVFRGPSKVKHNDKPVYEVDLRASTRFRPIDQPDAE